MYTDIKNQIKQAIIDFLERFLHWRHKQGLNRSINM
jgi:hypothetical protein